MEQPKVKPKGKVYICGAGPADPDLLTLKASKLLSKCDVILYDRLVNKRILRMASQRSKKYLLVENPVIQLPIKASRMN